MSVAPEQGTRWAHVELLVAIPDPGIEVDAVERILTAAIAAAPHAVVVTYVRPDGDAVIREARMPGRWDAPARTPAEPAPPRYALDDVPVTPPPASRLVRVDLPYHRPPLSLNDSNGNPHKTRADRKKVRHDVGFVFRSRPFRRLLGGPHEHLTVQLHWRPATNRQRDTDNLAATEKPVWDALVDAGVVVDDNTRHLTRRTPEIHPVEPGKPGAVWLTVEIPHA